MLKIQKFEYVGGLFMSNIEFEDDVVFARFLNYMQIALLHRKLNYEKHNESIKKQEEKLNYVEWTKIPDKTDNNPFENLKRDYDNLKIAIEKLTPEQRYVIINYYFKNKTLSKIAKKLNSNVNAVKQLKLRAVLSLRRYMEE